ncbi:MAG TPA: CehA/McbA family metallohydrolase [Candidatus Hydrogenedentes bacterium]|nr:CehA/McbA family metallohydrolase [Candidatus Hydrogenedentota bacterium]HPG69492.1 CehA/McbA family metallohydrolase [Candidatus Hydrogenedentota bacterium]
MPIRLDSPYRDADIPWLRGNLHTHTTNSDGPYSPQDTVDAYAALGYDFLMISDHDQLTEPASLDNRSMTLIPGNEISANGPHLLHVGADRVLEPDADRQRVIDAIGCDGHFAILNHPNWEKSFNHCPQECLDRWQGYAGIEIYNGIIRNLEGSPFATDRWDRLLAQGRRVWGYATDDCHRPGDLAVAWTMVQAPRSVAGIVTALREGRCYCSTGVTIARIAVDGLTVRIETANAHRIIAYGDYAYRIAHEDGPAMTFTVPEDIAKRYVRFECWGAGEAIAWTQPFFIERAD